MARTRLLACGSVAIGAEHEFGRPLDPGGASPGGAPPYRPTVRCGHRNVFLGCRSKGSPRSCVDCRCEPSPQWLFRRYCLAAADALPIASVQPSSRPPTNGECSRWTSRHDSSVDLIGSVLMRPESPHVPSWVSRCGCRARDDQNRRTGPRTVRRTLPSPTRGDAPFPRANSCRTQRSSS
jgi:hypothetical protein